MGHKYSRHLASAHRNGRTHQSRPFLRFVINTALFVRVFILLRIHVFKTEKSSVLIFFFLLLLFGKIVLVNYTFNQISVLILWTMFEAYHLLKKGHWVWAILILCLGINIKIMPIVLAPYIIVMGKKPFQIIRNKLGLERSAIFTCGSK